MNISHTLKWLLYVGSDVMAQNDTSVFKGFLFLHTFPLRFHWHCDPRAHVELRRKGLPRGSGCKSCAESNKEKSYTIFRRASDQRHMKSSIPTAAGLRPHDFGTPISRLQTQQYKLMMYWRDCVAILGTTAFASLILRAFL